MTFSLFLIPILISLSQALVFQIAPGGHPEFLFGVPVSGGFRQTTEARSVLRRFLLSNWTAAVLAALVGCAGMAQKDVRLLVGGVFLQLAAATATFLYSKSRIEPFAVESRSSVRRASLRPEPLMAWWGWALLVLPLLIMAASAAYLAQHWDQIPARFPVHWGADGQPNRWSEKSFKGVYGVLVIGLSTLTVLYGVTAMTAIGAPRGGRAMARLVRATLYGLAGISVLLSLLMSYIALHPLAANPERTMSPLWIIVPAMAGSIGLVLTMSRIANDAEAETGGAPEEGWRMSSVYYNPKDSAMMVQRRIGVGFTPNFAHPVVKWAFPLLLVQLIGVVYYVGH